MSRNISRVAVASLLALFIGGCRHDWARAEEFAQAVRCGMSEDEIRRLATERFSIRPENMWRQHSSNIFTVRSRELDFVDILLQGGEAVAVQRGNLVSFTTGMEFGEIRMLCDAASLSASRLRDYDPK